MSKEKNPLDPKLVRDAAQEKATAIVAEAAKACDGDVAVGIEALTAALPEGLTIEQVEASKAVIHGVIAGATSAQVDHASRVFKTFEDKQAVSIKVALGATADLEKGKGDFVTVTTLRSKDSPDPKNGGTRTVYGSTNVDVQLQMARRDVGPTQSARDRIKAAVAKALGKDADASNASD